MANSGGEDLCLEVAGDDPSCATIVLRGEDHTMGNAVRYMLARRPGVEFAGYSIPHPSEDRLNIRVQTIAGGESAAEAFGGSVKDLAGVADVIAKSFLGALEEFSTSMKQ
ncbi:hypothetical protein NDN08_004550 [Rhodosorus marinus]|uniref:DNA-directed RNA polymerase RBP11-like dimerisation domain-containing protein n=1 Tax=Rhodosorus marinus TaxID=101924 RepID=A0AAV8UQQ4_9RHOD|nr:hypothetical protein NDN08_004550 [Rhodosorus marinus]